MMAPPEKGEKWGILGGTFDPVHRGHVTLANEICLKKHLAGVLLVPAGNHPFKESTVYASFDDRVRMLELATSQYEYLRIVKIEQEEQLSGFTLDTLKAVKKRFPGVDFCFIIGADNISQIRNWHKFEEIFDEVEVVAGTRPSYDTGDHRDPIVERIHFVETTPVDVSSSKIRDMVAGGGDLNALDDWVGKQVKDYIIERELYQ